MNTTNAMDSGENPHPIYVLNDPNINISDIKQIIIMCPAIIFAKSLIINAKGLVNTPKISTGIKIGFTPTGTGGLKICAQ